MKRGDVAIALVGVLSGATLAACFATPCRDESTLEYSLPDGVYQSRLLPGTAPEIRPYRVEGPLIVDMDPAAERVTVSFPDAGRTVELRYAVSSIERP